LEEHVEPNDHAVADRQHVENLGLDFDPGPLGLASLSERDQHFVASIGVVRSAVAKRLPSPDPSREGAVERLVSLVDREIGMLGAGGETRSPDRERRRWRDCRVRSARRLSVGHRPRSSLTTTRTCSAFPDRPGIGFASPAGSPTTGTVSRGLAARGELCRSGHMVGTSGRYAGPGGTTTSMSPVSVS
jgi:hypothetical protein